MFIEFKSKFSSHKGLVYMGDWVMNKGPIESREGVIWETKRVADVGKAPHSLSPKIVFQHKMPAYMQSGVKTQAQRTMAKGKGKRSINPREQRDFTSKGLYLGL